MSIHLKTPKIKRFISIKPIQLLSLFALFVLIKSTNAQQRFSAGVKAGISTSQVSGDNYSGYNKAGVIIGGYAQRVINEKWNARFEIMYIQKGSRHNASPDKGDYNYYYLGVNYIEIPLLFQYRQSKFTYEFGPSYAALVNERETLNGYDLTGLRPFNKNELSINIGISYEIYKNLTFNWRLSNSVTPIRAHASGASKWYNPGQLNDVLAFTLNYTFNGTEQK